MNSQAVTAPVTSNSSQYSAVAPPGKSPQASFWARHKVTILTGVAIFGILAITAVALVTFPPAAIIPYLVAVGMPSGVLSPIIAAGILGGLSAFTAGISGGLIDYKYRQFRTSPKMHPEVLEKVHPEVLEMKRQEVLANLPLLETKRLPNPDARSSIDRMQDFLFLDTPFKKWEKTKMEDSWLNRTKKQKKIEEQLKRDFRGTSVVDFNGALYTTFADLEKAINQYGMSRKEKLWIYEGVSQTSSGMTSVPREQLGDNRKFLEELEDNDRIMLVEVSKLRYYRVAITPDAITITLPPLVSRFTQPESRDEDPTKSPWITATRLKMGRGWRNPEFIACYDDHTRPMAAS